MQRLVLLLVLAGILPFVFGATRLLRPHSASARPPAASILWCAFAFNMSFFWQELWLVIPKAIAGLSPILYHNDHDWTRRAPVGELLQGTGALATLCSGLAAFALMAVRRASSVDARLLLFWLAFQGLFQSLTQFAIGSLLPGNDVGRALAYLGAGSATKAALCVASVLAMAGAGLGLAHRAPAELVAARAAGTRAAAAALLATAAGAVLVSVPFRAPRDWIEVLLIPAVVNLVGTGWLVLGMSFTRSAAPVGRRQSLGTPLLALAALLVFFQFVLRPGVRF